jgi:hypothetical protein
MMFSGLFLLLNALVLTNLPAALYAAESPQMDTHQTDGYQLDSGRMATWSKLLHYQKSSFGIKSSIDNQDFFLHPTASLTHRPNSRPQSPH